MRSRTEATVASPRPVVLYGDALVVRDGRPSPWRPHPAVAVALVLMALVFLLNLTPTTVVAIGVGTVLGIQTTVAVDRGRRVAEDLAEPVSLGLVACAVADGLHAAGLAPMGAVAVRARDDRETGHYFLDAAEPAAALFARSLEEVLRPVDAPAYVVQRWVLTDPVDNAQGMQVALGRLRPDAVVWHGIPTAMSTTEESAQTFARAWDHWVGGGSALSAGSTEGQAVVEQSRGSTP